MDRFTQDEFPFVRDGAQDTGGRQEVSPIYGSGHTVCLSQVTRYRAGLCVAPESLVQRTSGVTNIRVFKSTTSLVGCHKSIMSHLRETHGVSGTIHRRDLLASTSILRTVPDKRKLVLSEAIHIKVDKPSLNAQNEGADKILNIFKH